VVRAEERLSEDLEEATRSVVLTRGLGRSYGDSSLPPEGRGPVAGSRLADRLITFDAQSGLLRAEAGLPLFKLNRIFLPRGWSIPVSPGTQFVTLGGMAASDVHGKNHHVAGCFGEHVRALRMRVADGRILEVSEQLEAELFRATLGGMGLTGHILEVELRLQRVPSAWIWQEVEPAPDLDRLVTRLLEASHRWPFTVGWVDALAGGAAMGRGLLIKGRWAEPSEAPASPPALRDPISLPLCPPNGILGRRRVKAFNAFYWRWNGRRRSGIVHPVRFFYPLDALLDWNRLYGRRGFTQYQCVLPAAVAGSACGRLFDALARRRGASFLTVVKDCGAEGRGMLSFPRPGISVALDLPMEGESTQRLIDALNEVVLEHEGRIYLTKDALTRREHFEAMEPRLGDWNAVRRRWDADGRLVSAQSVRLLGDER
jgi:FAD/FMN-containing dehydrogenase